MERHVGVAVSKESAVIWNIHAADYATASFDKTVNVETVADSEIGYIHVRLSFGSEDIAETVHIESQAESQRLVERRVGGCRKHV